MNKTLKQRALHDKLGVFHDTHVHVTLKANDTDFVYHQSEPAGFKEGFVKKQDISALDRDFKMQLQRTVTEKQCAF